jgi:hypothetical protein
VAGKQTMYMHNVFVAIPFMLLSRQAPTEMHKENLNSIPLQSIKSGARPQILKCHKKFFKEKERLPVYFLQQEIWPEKQYGNPY